MEASKFTIHMTGRIIAIGDIHGCHQEFSELLTLLQLKPADRLILLGDLVNRGPHSIKVIELAQKHNAIALLGNHEARLLKAYRRQDPSGLRANDLLTYQKMRTKDWHFLEGMKLTHEEPELDTVFVHGGFLPKGSWKKQPLEVVTRIQSIDKDGVPRKRREAPDALPWADFWTGPPFVIYGHSPRAEVYKRDWSLGLDTACAMGGKLTAYILPEKHIIQVYAHQSYFP